jgi:acyl-CoA synthetase (AMP-forming)/AMP-acid ligase II
MSTIVERFADLRRRAPDRVLMHLPGAGGALTAANIWDAHVAYAALLAEARVEPGQLVVSAAGNHYASVAVFLACRARGIALMPVDAGTTRPEILALGERFSAAALLLPSAMIQQEPCDTGEGVFPLAGGLCLVRRAEPAPRSYSDFAVLKLTSGSSGSPKAVLTNEAQLTADGIQIADGIGIHPPDTQIAAIPLSHAWGLGVLVMPLVLQGTAIVLRESFVPQQLPLDARRFGARLFPGVPFMFEYFIANPPAEGWPGGLQRLISAGAPLAPATVREFHEQFGVKIHSFYGTTETGGIAFEESDDIEESAHALVGRPLPGVTITLRNDDDLPAGARRIHVSSAAVAHGYSDDVNDGFDREGFLTGDYGTIDASGRLTLEGRVSSFVNVAGRKVQPEEVERVLRAMPGVQDVRVLAAPDSRRGQQIVACVVASGTPDISVLGLRRFCAARLAAHKIPRAVVFLEAIPLTPRGKTDRAALETIVRAQLEI